MDVELHFVHDCCLVKSYFICLSNVHSDCSILPEVAELHWDIWYTWDKVDDVRVWQTHFQSQASTISFPFRTPWKSVQDSPSREKVSQWVESVELSPTHIPNLPWEHKQQFKKFQPQDMATKHLRMTPWTPWLNPQNLNLQCFSLGTKSTRSKCPSSSFCHGHSIPSAVQLSWITVLSTTHLQMDCVFTNKSRFPELSRHSTSPTHAGRSLPLQPGCIVVSLLSFQQICNRRNRRSFSDQ